jgi:hypothetical protein
VLGALSHGLDSVPGICVALQLPDADVRAALDQLIAAGYVSHSGQTEAAGYHLTLTGEEAAGQSENTTPRRFGSSTFFSVTVRSSRSPAGDEWAEVGNLVGQAWQATRDARHEELARRDDGLLVGDVERESALALLAQAFGEGKLSQEEHDRRTDIVLSATDRGDLDRAMTGLDPGANPARGRRGFAFWVLTGLALPVFVVALLLLGSPDQGRQTLAGVVIVALPCFLGLAWWAQRHPGKDYWRP